MSTGFAEWLRKTFPGCDNAGRYGRRDMLMAFEAGGMEALRLLGVSTPPLEEGSLRLLRRAHVEIRRWKSCQNIGTCRNCADDGFLLQLGLFLELHKDEGSPASSKPQEHSS